MPIRFSEEEIARHIVAAREISLTLLPLMPELLNEEAYANVIDANDSATLKAFWQIQLPPTPVLRLEAMSVIPMTAALVQQVRESPKRLELEDKSGRTVLTYIVRFGNIAAVQALIDANLIDWQRLRQSTGRSTPLLLAIWRQKYDDDYVIFPLILKDMLAKNAPLSAEEIMNCIKDGMTADDFFSAGMSNTQFCSAIEQSLQRKRQYYRRIDYAICNPRGVQSCNQPEVKSSAENIALTFRFLFRSGL
ncbi:TPA: ankyrin repeat domain-containing protein [Escherichia coli]|uniref:ankyrin repeat domain-containing protein n=1 Tax=Escherichia coli TaxID=562 RepID=UPI002021D86E|nr:ankyrin repeat domain-containing protein [Escherichia coli]MCV5811590.1 ankyrin repeat domain-containing protein [Escherichia coli]